MNPEIEHGKSRLKISKAKREISNRFNSALITFGIYNCTHIVVPDPVSFSHPPSHWSSIQFNLVSIPRCWLTSLMDV